MLMVKEWSNMALMTKTMTLGEFRKFTEHLSDDIKLSYYYAGGNFPIGTMNPIGDDMIEFASNNYGEANIEGCCRVAVFCKKKED